MKYKELWDLESAMQVLQHKTVDAKLWSEAVEWLLLHGPQEIKQLLLDASEIATGTAFPDLKPSQYTPEGQPYYDISALAKTLGLTEDQTREILQKKDMEQNGQQSEKTDENIIVN
jgi:hypothetical protein